MTAARMRLRLVLGSGGIKPVAAVPLLEFLDTQGIAVDEIVACSGGAVVGALYAAGLSGREVRQTITRVLQPNFFTAVDPFASRLVVDMLRGRRRPGGMLRPDRILTACRSVFGDVRVEALPCRLLLQATELDTRRGVVLRRGPLSEALYASIAVYPLLPPIEIGGQWLIDGAFSAPLPLLASPRPATLTVAVSSNQPGARDIVDRLLGFATEANIEHGGSGQCSDVMMIQLPITRRVRFWDMHLIPDLLALGEQVVAEHGARIVAALTDIVTRNAERQERRGLPPRQPAAASAWLD
jgi:NTE family protein